MRVGGADDQSIKPIDRLHLRTGLPSGDAAPWQMCGHGDDTDKTDTCPELLPLCNHGRDLRYFVRETAGDKFSLTRAHLAAAIRQHRDTLHRILPRDSSDLRHDWMLSDVILSGFHRESGIERGSPGTSVPAVYGLDVSDVSRWEETVLEPALQILHSLSKGESPATEPIRVEGAGPANKRSRHTCELCDKVIIGDLEWTAHLKSKKHHHHVRKRRKVEVCPDAGSVPGVLWEAQAPPHSPSSLRPDARAPGSSDASADSS
ncbi:unnamed protein product [Merluccius merluccius]